MIDAVRFNLDKNVKVWFQDEARFGLITNQRRRITLKGVKPIGLKQFEHESFWMYGAIEPLTGESFFMEYSVLDSVCFSDYLSKFSRETPKSLNIIFLDGSGGHIASSRIRGTRQLTHMVLCRKIRTDNGFKLSR